MSQSAEKSGSIAAHITPDDKDLGGFTVRRVLPATGRKMVGPFIFFDHLGPAHFPVGEGVDVRPHPHIGLATITYLFEGQLHHRDSLGNSTTIQPGEINLMTAGRGIVHSERSGDDRDRAATLHALQLWIALPEHEQEREADFEHVASDALPVAEEHGYRAKILLGSAFGLSSPVTTYSPTLYADIQVEKSADITVAADYSERAIYIVHGELSIDGQHHGAHIMLVLQPGMVVQVNASADSRFVVIGGEPVGKRFIEWNFASSSRERIEQAKEDWKAQRFDAVPGESEFIPLPE